MAIRRLIQWILLLSLSSYAAFAAQVTQVTLSQQGAKASLYFAVEGSFTHKIFTLAHPDRVVIDLNDARLNVNLQQAALNKGMIQRVRTGSPNSKALRLVFDVNQNVQASSSPWREGTHLRGIRIDLIGSKAAVAHTPALVLHPAIVAAADPNFHRLKQIPAQINSKQQAVRVPHSPSRKLKDVIVVLDAGHGGKDPGAKGPRRSQEKNVVLAITLKLKQLIDRQPGMRAVLTRSGDYYVGLRQRLDIARTYNGDIFVSIHADAFNNPHSNGASVFALSQGGATSEAARWIAEKENYSELGGVNLGDLDDANGVVRSVLIDLSQTATINASLQMGTRVLNQLDNFTHLHNNKVEQARFMVLKSPDTPSILVETGFISNPLEEKNLNSNAYQTRLSQAIFQGIKGYFWANPPHGTHIEDMAARRLHLVRSGETLPSIARLYHISLDILQKANHLSARAGVKPGQQLVIPATWA